MDLLYTSLKNIFSDYPKYNDFYSFEAFHYSLRNYLIQNIEDANFIIRPSDFAYSSKLNFKEALDILLLLSDYNAFIKNYEFTCDDCDNEIVTVKVDEIFYCSCGRKKTIDISSSDTVFDNVHHLFEITETVITETKKHTDSVFFTIDDPNGTLSAQFKKDPSLNITTDNLAGYQKESTLLNNLLNNLLNENLLDIS